jgi:hypothetical protein
MPSLVIYFDFTFSPPQSDVSQASKDVMDSIKYSASLTRSEYPPCSAESKSGQILKETMSQTYRGVPSSLEAESLQSKLTVSSLSIFKK